jgi:hypothetical protein
MELNMIASSKTPQELYLMSAQLRMGKTMALEFFGNIAVHKSFTGDK